jgi:uncharacterized membrane protein
MSNQPPYGNPPGGYPPPGSYPEGGYPPPPNRGKTQTLGLDYNIAALLCYLPVCCINVIFPILWLATEPRDNRFLRFHALQSLYLIGLVLAIVIVTYILMFIGAVDPTGVLAAALGLIAFILQLVVGFGALILAIIAMIKAYQHEMWKMPIVGNLAEKQA